MMEQDTKSVKNAYLMEVTGFYGIEDSANKLGQYFTVGGMLPSSFIQKQNIQHLRIEPIKTGRGYRRVFLSDHVIDMAKKLNIPITEKQSDLVKKRQEEYLETKESKLSDSIRQLESEINIRQMVLENLNKTIEIAAHKLSQHINDPLLNEDEIFLLAGIRRQKCGVYFLLKGDQIVYVGQSININERIRTHEKIKDFDKFTYVGCEKENLNEIEAKYILKFKPIYNYDSLGRLVLPMRIKI